MFTLRCTKKLLKRLDVPVHDGEATPLATTRLGDWIANVVFHDRRPLVLAASQATLLPVILPVAPAKTLPLRFPDAVVEMLEQIQIPRDQIDAEHEAMSVCVVEPARVADRVSLGSLNDFAVLLDRWLETSLLDAAVRLSGAPCGPLKMERPADVTRALFALAANEG